ncbi:hypothetical protein [Crossiella cryophila]|uniref:Uncharacterized protein n=1 Tax=Crossiella cryophila TaxID=43355 RepID=A0A7W7FR96_9PSEU|nr:hypothetical protein [Crossiella cryophila]MBB4675726.1 hypothetical protein [Crossiella cryophila]
MRHARVPGLLTTTAALATGPAESPAFTAPAPLHRRAAGKAELIGAATIRRDAVPGAHKLSFYCGPSRYSKTITVLDKDKPAPPPGPGPVVVKPKGGVETGGGLS